MSRRPQQPVDDVYEVYDPKAEQASRHQLFEPVSLAPTRPSSTSTSTRSLRKVRRLPVRTKLPQTPSPPERRPQVPQRLSPEPVRLSGQDVSFDKSGSTTPQSFKQLVEEESYWPQRSTHISRRTHDAILFALEAIRKGRGVDANPLTSDLLEESARMSDLFRGNQPTGVSVSGRPQNGGTRPAQDAGPVPTEPIRYRTPTDIMRDRRDREARKAEEQKQRQLQAEESRRRQEQEAAARDAEQAQPQPQVGQPTSQTTQGYTIGEGGAAPSRQRQETISAAPQAQARPTSQQRGHARVSSNTQRNRTDAFERLNIPATAQPATQTRSTPAQPITTATTTSQPRAGFPHAFERWETLSSQWEGLTSYWIRRLQENTNELSGKPIDQQMSRQITDLSAAGANLFHAVVELQRLRASSERKFQRWFFETRNEQEQSAEKVAQLERQLQTERETRTVNSGSIETIRAEKTRAEELVREMRRELQISKEEARRAWEELGRREQEERDRTIALRNGRPTLIGGVQVVPMQDMASRQASSAQRPQTRDGSFGAGSGAPGPGVMGGQTTQIPRPPSRSQTTTTSLDSPGEEGRQFTYRPGGASPTSTDPFTESARGNEPHQLRHEPDTQFLAAPTQPATSSAAIAAARAAASPQRSGQQLPTTNGRFYQQPDPQTTIHNPLPATGIPTTQGFLQPTTRSRSNTGQSEGRSYIPSTTGSSLGEEEYHINPDGSYTLDSRGRRIPYNQPIAQEYRSDDDDNIGEEESDDYAADIERERMYAQQYGASPQRGQPQTGQTSGSGLGVRSGNIPRPAQSGQSGGLMHDIVTSTPPSGSQTQLIPQQMPLQPQTQQSSRLPGQTIPNVQAQMAQQILSQEYEDPELTGFEGLATRHRHPTRLSDIIEEQTARTSPSRASGSYTAGAPGAGSGLGQGTGNVARPR